MKVVSFRHVVPATNKNTEKLDILTKFVQGVNVVGDNGIFYEGEGLVDCDVAVIQGWQHVRGKGSAHLRLRHDIIQTQLQNKKFVCTADSNLFLYANRSNHPHHYLRYSFNGVFPNTGIYFDNIIDPARWNKISADLNIKLEPRKKNGRHILFCLQRDGGWSMQGISIYDWTLDVISKIRNYSDRPIVIRAHPGDGGANEYLTKIQERRLRGVSISKFDTPLDIDLQRAWAVVNHNSSSIVGPLIQGYPGFITDPDTSQCSEVTHHTFSEIENPRDFDREKWLQRISMFHWSFAELENGAAWRHIRNYCQ